MTEPLSMMGIYAHPDDEQGVSGSLHKYGKIGVNTTLICATRGEVGEIAPGTRATPEILGEVREQEMRCAAQIIGIKHLFFLDYRDSGMMGTPENDDKRSLNQADLLDVTGKITRIIREQRPQVILTFDPWGGYGHPDHIKIHQATLVAYFVAGDPRAYPEQLSAGGLVPWAPQKLYYGAFTRSRFKAFYEYMKDSAEQPTEMMLEFQKRGVPDEVITTRIDVSQWIELKLESLKCHATQLGPNTFFARIPEEVRREALRTETFILAESRVGRPQDVEKDFFTG